jgi:hypothetical protein
LALVMRALIAPSAAPSAAILTALQVASDASSDVLSPYTDHRAAACALDDHGGVSPRWCAPSPIWMADSSGLGIRLPPGPYFLGFHSEATLVDYTFTFAF